MNNVNELMGLLNSLSESVRKNLLRSAFPDEYSHMLFKKAFIEIVKRSDLNALNVIIKGKDINAVLDIAGNTMLHYAVIYGNEELVKFLLNEGADPLIKNHKGKNSHDCINMADMTKRAELKNALGMIT